MDCRQRFAALVAILLFSTVSAFAQFTYTEDFKNSTAAGWVLDPAGNSVPAPVLTSGAAPRSGDPEFGSSVIDQSGAGWLRLTNNTNNLHNAVYFDTPIPSAGNSVNITFGVNMWGGNNFNGTGADGITFFLYDASKPFIVGANGGSIGYAQKAGVGPDNHDGLNGGWVGIALDAYGNYSVAGEGRQGGTGSLQPNSIAVRGPGDGTTGYNYLAGTGNRDYTDTGSATVLDAGDGTVPALPYTMAFATAPSRPNQSTQYRNVSITFDENSQLGVQMQFGEDGLWYDVLNVDLSSFVRPEQLKMGFAAGTGGGTQVYEIGGLLSVTATAGSGNFVWDNGEGAGNKVWGTDVNNPLNWAGNTNPTLKGNVLFNNSFVTTAQNINVTGSDKVIKNMYFSGNQAYTLSTGDQRQLIFDSDSTGVPTSINLTNDAINGNASHTIAMNVQMNKNLEINNNLGGATPFTVSGNIDNNGNNLALKGVGTTNLSGILSGTGNLTKFDSGTTVLSGASANTYSGATTVNAGVLQIGKAGALGNTSTGTTVNNGGTLALGGSGTTFAAEGLTISGTGSAGQGALANVAGNNTWTGSVALAGSGTNSIGVDGSTNLTVAGVVSGAAGNNLVKSGTGTLTLSGTNTFTGSTTINAGTLSISNETNLGANPGSFSAGHLTLDGGTLRTTTSAVTIDDANRGVTVGAGGGTFETQTNLTIANAVAGSGALAKTGPATLTLSGTNTHTGSVAVNAGTLAASGGSALGDNSAVTIAGGATFTTAGFSETVGSIGGAGNVALGSGSTTLTVGGNNSSTTFAGVISGDASAHLAKTGTGTLTLSGANTFTGNLQVNQGTVTLGASNVLSNSSTLLLNGGTFAVGGSFSDTIGRLTLASSSTIDYASNTSSLTFTNATRTGGTLTIDNWAGDPFGAGSSQLVFTSGADFTSFGGANINFTGWGTGSTRLGTGEIVPNTGGTIYTYALTGNGNWNVDNNWSDSGLPANADPGNYPGRNPANTANTIGDTAILGSAATGAASISLNGGDRTLGYLVVNSNQNHTVTGNNLVFDVNSGLAQITNAGTGTQTIASGVRLNDSLNVLNSGTGALTITGGITNNTGINNLTVTGTGATTFAGNITTGTGTLTKDGTGTLTLGGAASTFSGGTTINGGMVRVSADANLGATSGAVSLNGGILENTASFTLNVGRLVTIGAAGGTLDTNAGTTLTYAGALAGAGTLTKADTGTLVLSGNNTHTGNVVVNAGNLTTSGGSSIGNSALITVNGGSSLWQTNSAETVGNIAGTGQIVFGSTNTLTFGDATNQTFSGVISSGAFAGALVKQGSGTVVLSGANTYSGTTTVNAGTLNLQHATGLGSTAGGTTVASGATLALQHATGIAIGTEAISLAGTGVAGGGALRSVAGNNSLAGNLALTAAAKIQSDADTLTLTGNVTGTGFGLTIDGSGQVSISGQLNTGAGGSLTKTGTGYLTLANSGTYTGATTIGGGTVEIRDGASLGTTAGATTVATGATLALSNNITVGENLTVSGQGVGSNGAVRNLSGNNTLTGTVALGAESYLGTAAGSTLTLTGPVSGAFGLAKVGDGTLVLNSASANTYTGTTAITGGTLEVRRSDALGAVNATTIASGASLRLNGSGLTLAENFTVNGTGFNNAGALQNTGGNNTLTGAITMTGHSVVSATTGTTLAADGVIAGAYNLVKDGPGGLTLGSNANTYTGTTTVRDGTLTVTTDAPVSSNGALGNAASVVQLGDSGTGGSANLALLIGDTDGGSTISRQIAVNNFGSTATLGATNTSGTNTFAGNITLGRDTTLTAGSDGTVAFAGTISGTGGLTSTGTATSTTVLGGNNTFSGNVSVTSGNLVLTHANALGSTAGATSVSSGASLSLQGGLTIPAGEALTLNGSGVSGTVGALNNAAGDNTVAGPVTFNTTSTVTAQSGTSLTLAGALGGTGGLTTAGAGNLTLTGSNSFSGATTLGGTGVVTLSGAGSGALGSTSGVTLGAGSILSLGASNQINDSANLTFSGGTLLLNGNQDVLNNVSLTASTTSILDYLNDNSLLRFTGTASVGASSQLTIDNWAGNPTTGGSSNYGLLFNSQAQALAFENNVLFNGWAALGSNSVIANGSFWEIVPIVTVREWNIATGGNWDIAGNTNWTGNAQPDATGAIALFGNAITSGSSVSISTSGGGADTEIIGKMIFDTTGGRNYSITGSDRVDFDVAGTGGTTQLIVAGDGQHTIATTGGVRVLDDLVIINDGTAATPLTITSNMDLRNGTLSDLTVAGSGRTVINGTISNNTAGAALLKTGSGTLALSGTNTFTGTTTIRNGTLELAGNAPSGAAGNLGNTTSAVIINDAGTSAGMNTALLMTNATGGNTVGRAITVGSQGATTTLGGTNTSGTNTFSGAISLAKDVALTAAAGGTVNFSGVLSGTGGLDKVGAGTVTLSGATANSNSGNVTVTAGTLSIDKTNAGGNGAIGDTASVTIASGATLRFNGGANQTNETIGSLAGAGTLNNQQATALTLTTGGNNASTTFSGSLTDTGGDLTLVKTGTGTLTLSGNNSHDGQTNINAGTLVAASNTALGSTAGNTTVALDATLGLQGNVTITGEQLDLAAKANPNIASVANLGGTNTFTGSVSLTGGTAGDDVKLDAAAGSQLTFSGVISEATNRKDVAKTGSGTVVFSGNNTYTGETSVAAGTLVVGHNNALGAATGAATDDTFVQIGATLGFDHATGVTIGSGEAITVYTTAAPANPSLKNIGGANTVQGDLTLTGGVNTGALLNANAGNLTLTGALVSSTPSNNNFLTKTGAGTLTLAGTTANTFQGPFNVNDGTVILNKTSGLTATGTGALNIGDGVGAANSAIVQLGANHQINNGSAVAIATDGRLELQAHSDAIGALTMSGGSVTAIGAGTLTLGGTMTFNGIGTNTAAITANVDLGGNRIFQVGNNAVSGDRDLTVNGTISGAGSSFTKTDLGTLELTGAANTFTGNFQVTDGTVILNKTAVAGVKGNATGVNNATVTVGDNFRGANTAILEVSGDGLTTGQTSDQIADTATLVMNTDGRFALTRSSGTAGFTETVGAIAGAGNIDLGSFSLIAGGNNASTSFSGTLAGTSAALLTKTGTGTLTIGSNLGYGGNIELAGGTLAFDASNTFSGNLDMLAGTTLRLTDADLVFDTLHIKGNTTIDFAGSVSSLNVFNLIIDGGAVVTIANWQYGYDYFYAQNWFGASFDTRGAAPMNQVVFSPGWSNNATQWQSYDKQINPVPEPSTYGAILIGLSGALLGYRRHRRSKVAATGAKSE